MIENRLYPMSRTFLENYSADLKGYRTSKGAVQFPLDEPLPIKLITKIITGTMKQLQTNKH